MAAPAKLARERRGAWHQEGIHTILSLPCRELGARLRGPSPRRQVCAHHGAQTAAALLSSSDQVNEVPAKAWPTRWATPAPLRGAGGQRQEEGAQGWGRWEGHAWAPAGRSRCHLHPAWVSTRSRLPAQNCPALDEKQTGHFVSSHFFLSFDFFKIRL